MNHDPKLGTCPTCGSENRNWRGCLEPDCGQSQAHVKHNDCTDPWHFQAEERTRPTFGNKIREIIETLRGATPEPPTPAKCPTCGGTRNINFMEVCDDDFHCYLNPKQESAVTSSGAQPPCTCHALPRSECPDRKRIVTLANCDPENVAFNREWHLVSANRVSIYGSTYARPGESIQTCNVGAWYETACYWRDEAERLRGATQGSSQGKGNMKNSLHLEGAASEPIWLMADGEEPHVIGIRLDCGDAGVVYVTREQAADLAQQLSHLLNQLGGAQGSSVSATPDPELCDNQNNHPKHCHCLDPL